jgi:hypothetical protein
VLLKSITKSTSLVKISLSLPPLSPPITPIKHPNEDLNLICEREKKTHLGGSIIEEGFL